MTYTASCIADKPPAYTHTRHYEYKDWFTSKQQAGHQMLPVGGCMGASKQVHGGARATPGF